MYLQTLFINDENRQARLIGWTRIDDVTFSCFSARSRQVFLLPTIDKQCEWWMTLISFSEMRDDIWIDEHERRNEEISFDRQLTVPSFVFLFTETKFFIYSARNKHRTEGRASGDCVRQWRKPLDNRREAKLQSSYFSPLLPNLDEKLRPTVEKHGADDQ